MLRGEARVGLILVALGVAACGPGPGPADGAVDAPGEAEAGADAPLADAPAHHEAGADDSGAVDSAVPDVGDAQLDDGGACFCGLLENPCMVWAGCPPDCVPETRENGEVCSGTGMCEEGVCVTGPPGCGDGLRSSSGPREGCDDGSAALDDACSDRCIPRAVIVASAIGASDIPAAQVPAIAVDGAGSALFVWLSTRVVGGEPVRALLARRYSSTGVPIDMTPLHLEDGVGASQPVRPSVAGRPAGWVVTWRSTAIEGLGGEQGGIAYRLVSHDGILGATRQGNATEALDQLDPVVVALSTGFVLVWTDQSEEIVTGNLRMRAFASSGAPSGGELNATITTLEDQGHAVAAARGDATTPGTRWALAYTDTSTCTPDRSSCEPRVRLRRFDGTSAVDASDFLVAHAWGSQPAVTMTATDTVVAWQSRGVDVRGDIAVRRIIDGATPATDADVDPYPTSGSIGMLTPVDEQPSVAPFLRDGTAGYVVAWRTDSRLTGSPGGRLAAPSSVTTPLEWPDLQALVGANASALTLAATDRGLWVGWSDTAMTDANDAFVAYLLPWD